MSNDLSSEILGLKSEINSVRADVNAVRMSQSLGLCGYEAFYNIGVDICKVEDRSYQQSVARNRGVNRVFSLSDEGKIVWVIERPTWLKENGGVYSICSCRMCEYYNGNSTIYKVCCGELDDGKVEPGAFYMGKSGDSITVAFRKASDSTKDLSCYLGEYDTAIAIGVVYRGESKPTSLVCGAITPGGGSQSEGDWPWKTEIDEDSGSVKVYSPRWSYIVVNKEKRETNPYGISIGSRSANGWIDAGRASKTSVVFAKLSSRSDTRTLDCNTDDKFPKGLSVEFCSYASGDERIITPDVTYIRLGTVKKEENEEILPDGTSCKTCKYKFTSHNNILKGQLNDGIVETIDWNYNKIFKKDTCGKYHTIKEDGEFYDASCKYKYIATNIASVETRINGSRVVGLGTTIVLDDDKKPTEACSSKSVKVKDVVLSGGYEVVPFLWANFLECNCSCALSSNQCSSSGNQCSSSGDQCSSSGDQSSSSGDSSAV